MVIEIITAVSSLILGIFGKSYWDNRTVRSNNETKKDLKKLQLEKEEQDILLAQNKILIEKVKHLELIIERTNAYLEMLIELLRKEFKERPDIINAFEMINENLKKKASEAPQ